MASCSIFGLSANQIPGDYAESDIIKAVQFQVDSLMESGVERFILSLLPGIDMWVAEYAFVLHRQKGLKELVVVKPPMSAWDDLHARERDLILAGAMLKAAEYDTPELSLREQHISQMLQESDQACIISSVNVTGDGYIEAARHAAKRKSIPVEETTIEAMMRRLPGSITPAETQPDADNLPTLFLGSL